MKFQPNLDKNLNFMMGDEARVAMRGGERRFVLVKMTLRNKNFKSTSLENALRRITQKDLFWQNKYQSF